MDPVLKLKGLAKRASISYAGESDFSFLDEWKKSIQGDKNPIRLDAYNFAKLAVKRYKAHSSFENYATSREEIADFVVDNPRVEVANLVVLKAAWFTESSVIGICHFRRTWSNNIIVDYLSVHPFVAKPKDDLEIKGAGTALVCYISDVAAELKSQLLWGEATQHSCHFYQKLLGLQEVQDLICAPESKFAPFATKVVQAYREATIR